jgi:PPM family protein phosphatase
VTVTDFSPKSRDSGPRRGVLVHVFGRTDVGRTREHNEDAFVVADLTNDNATLQPEVRTHVSGDKGSLFMVADGMGGAAAGEIASAMAVDVVLGELRRIWMEVQTSAPEEFARALRRATASANVQINAYATSHPEYRGMGTTATIAGLLQDTLYLAQVGDSRAYLIRDGVAKQITKDQSLMQKLIEAGELTEEEALQSDRRNIILQALGPDVNVKVDLTHQAIRRGDALVLCSDGLSGQVSRDEIAQVVNEEPDLMAVCKRLIDLANERGGPDNITVIVAKFEGALGDASNGDEVGHKVFPLPDTGQVAAVVAQGDATNIGNTPTEPVPVQKRPTVPLPQDAIVDDAGGAPTAIPASEPGSEVAAPVRPGVSPQRRRTGMAIAILLMLALILFAAWFLFNKAKEATTPAVDSTSTPSKRSA